MLIFAIIEVLLASSLAIAVDSAAAIPTGMMSVTNRPVSASWIRINGAIDQWGTTDARGQLQTQARTALLQSSDTRQLASATAIWTTNTFRAIQAVRAKENFTYVFYAARLLNASVSTLSTGSSASNYFINGTWNVATVKSTVTIITNENGNITRVLRNQDRRRTARIAAIRTFHRTIQSVGATGGVYKGQGRSQRELMTRAY